ncbi:MAG: hypothetical protein ACTSQE_07385 [Candidatus Heimdallarchaeaceae archaeon]
METRLELVTELQGRLSAVSTSTVFTTTWLQDQISNAYLWVGSRKPWPPNEKGWIADSLLTQEYYDYPANCKTGSILRLTLDSIEYDKKNFEDYLDYIKENPSDTKTKIFSEYARQYFIFPAPTTNGTDNINIWGTEQVAKLENDSEVTIFSYSEPDINEAIILKAEAVGLKKIGKTSEAKERIEEAQVIIELGYTRIAHREQRNQRLDHPKFDVPDYFSDGQASIGNFEYKES